jgi:hypothetical protein
VDIEVSDSFDALDCSWDKKIIWKSLQIALQSVRDGRRFILLKWTALQ